MNLRLLGKPSGIVINTINFSETLPLGVHAAYI